MEKGAIVNSKYFGDSYDLVKRFFIEVLKSEGYTVYVAPMFTGNHAEMDKNYYLLIGAELTPDKGPGSEKTALFVDPDKGINEKKTDEYVTIQNVFERLKSCKFTLVLVFDQSFSRNKRFATQRMRQKLLDFSKQSVSGFFYNSHANFFFGALDKNKKLLEKYRCKLLQMGVPENRLIQLPRE